MAINVDRKCPDCGRFGIKRNGRIVCKWCPNGIENFCAVCGTDKKLKKHHLCYDPEITIFLCGSCHSKVHRYDPVKTVKKELNDFLGLIQYMKDKLEKNIEKCNRRI